MKVTLNSKVSTITAYRLTSGAAAKRPSGFDEMTIREFLKMKYDKGYHFGTDALVKSGCYREGGWEFDFRPFLKKYLVLSGYNTWTEAFAPTKTGARNAYALSRNVPIMNFPM